MLWALLFTTIVVGGLLTLGYLGLRVWRKAGALLGEVDVMAGRLGELADLLAQVEMPYAAGSVLRSTSTNSDSDEAWPGTVESYDDRGADAPGKKES